MSWTVACFCGNVYAAPSHRCEVCGQSIDGNDSGDPAPSEARDAREVRGLAAARSPHRHSVVTQPPTSEEHRMSTEDNKAVVARWFTDFWGPSFDPGVIDELAAPDIRFEYSLHEPLRGRDEVREFALRFREAFPDLGFAGTVDLIAEGDYVVGQWTGGGTHTGPAFDDLPVGSLPAGSGKKMQFTGTTVIKVLDGMIAEELGLDDGVAVLKQLGLIAQK
jgi:predicted ester cyclase/predicted nucleic acid-binding Zn ribbon protein